MGHRWTFCLGLTAILGGCAPELPTLEDDLELEFRGANKKDDWGCRTCQFQNSALAGPFEVAEVYLGKPGTAAVTLPEIEDPFGARYPLTVKQGRFQAHTGTATVEGMQLVGWKLIVASAGYEVPVEVIHVQPQPDWVTGAMVETYALSHQLGPQMQEIAPVNVCPGLPPDDTAVVLLENDRFDTTHKKVLPDNPGFVTLACRGHALAKMRMIGHSGGDGYGSTPHDRQAAFKMLTADYCGGGQSFTTIGRPLDWEDRLGNFPPVSSSAIEAHWDAGGAKCLEQPRNPAYDHQSVEAACGHTIPGCGGLWAGQLWTTYLVP